MTEEMETPSGPNNGNRRTLLIIGGILVLCCVCAVGAFVLYQYLGDPLLQMLGLQ